MGNHARTPSGAAIAPDPRSLLSQLSAAWSPDFDAYATGQLDASQVRCVLCTRAPCRCPEFGTSEYLALLDKRHGRRS